MAEDGTLAPGDAPAPDVGSASLGGGGAGAGTQTQFSVTAPVATPSASIDTTLARPERIRVTPALQIYGQPVPEPQRDWLFDVRLPSIGRDTPFVEVVDSAPFFQTIEKASEPIGGRHRFSAIMCDAGNLTLTLYHDQGLVNSVGHVAMEYIKYWMQQVQNEDGSFRYPYEYLHDISIDLLNVKRDTKYSILYYNCFPVAVAPVSLKSGGNDRTRIQVVFSVERIKPFLGDSSNTPLRAKIPDRGSEYPRVVQRLSL
jgi:hypothetical protein